MELIEIFKREILLRETAGLYLDEKEYNGLLMLKNTVAKKAEAMANVHQMLLQRQQFELIEPEENTSEDESDGDQTI